MLKFRLSVILTAIILSLCFVSTAIAALVGNTTQATLTASPQTGTYNVNDNFQVSIYINTNSQNVVGVAAYLNYDKTHFQAASIDTTSSIFTIEWEKIIDSANGKIKISRTIPTPGVNTSNGLVAKINFVALSSTSPGSDNLTFDFTAGSNLDSAVIKDDGLGTDILSGVYNAIYAVGGGTGDTTPPTVSITVPTAGVTVSGSSVTVSANASDNVGVVGVQFKLDGSNLGSEDTASPYSISWNTTQTSNGSHTLTATARDAVGNQTMSSGVAVTVNNAATDTTPPTISSVQSGAITSSGVTITWATNETSDSQVEYGLTASYGSQTTLNTSMVTSHSQPLSGLTASTLYHYRVKSRDAAGNLATSGDYTFTTTASAPSCTNRSFVSGSVSPSSVAAGGSYTISCDYGATTNAVNPSAGSGSCGFQSFVGTAARFSCTAGSTAGTFGNSCVLSYMSPDYYCARTDTINSLTVTGTGPSADSQAPSTPTNLSTSAISFSQINLSWTVSTDNIGVTGYRIYRCQGSGCTPSTQINTTAANSFSDTGLSANTTYVYNVAAYDAAGNVSGRSSVSSATTRSNTCTTFTYSAWSACQPNGTQSRTIVSASPLGCTGGSPVLSKSCTYTPVSNLCTSFTYSDWFACQPDNTQFRSIVSASPEGCSGGSPDLSQSCTYTPPVEQEQPSPSGVKDMFVKALSFIDRMLSYNLVIYGLVAFFIIDFFIIWGMLRRK